MTISKVGVIDIGKSNAKVAVVDLDTRTEIAVRKRPNMVRHGGKYPHFDVDGLWRFALDSLRELNAEFPLDALSVTTHGASAALIDEEGFLALPVLDYEFAGPDELRVEYDRVRPAFTESFTPRLPGGLNLGAQIFWQSRTFADDFARTRWILPYPQYWSFRLTGVAAAEITSLGCHTDLWDFSTDLYSSLVMKEGWLDRLPAVRPASDVLGLTLPEVTEAIGLRRPLPVYSGIHDSNASLLPHLLERQPPFGLVSTGTWVVVAAPGGDIDHLDPRRDCLANIDVFGRPVPSARFMGGREFEMLTTPREPDEETIERVLGRRIMLSPSVVQGSGPFADRQAQWTVPREELDDDEVYVVTSFYLAMMTAECLRLTGAENHTVVEGPFAGNPLYLRMLASATGRPVEPVKRSATGTSIGAALLARMDKDRHEQRDAALVQPDGRAAEYAADWQELVWS
ncbi:FGGY-family carbohydrate kinase [Devosia sp. ZB163]|uniref:FGGY-family carbohydrate kinase n=1 Tax=Devosia sp. ZB163 TaxID=3025938 RepID=UPI00236076E2|nr:FGGY-family carbohydrate kinase [Devosia sp. ZB163]MDC9822503.1 FGGY-family carbohydrate kinase [Devosia sp. ZB163]